MNNEYRCGSLYQRLVYICTWFIFRADEQGTVYYVVWPVRQVFILWLSYYPPCFSSCGWHIPLPALQSCSPVLLFIPALQCCSSDMLFSPALQSCSSVLLFSPALQSCSSVLLLDIYNLYISPALGLDSGHIDHIALVWPVTHWRLVWRLYKLSVNGGMDCSDNYYSRGTVRVQSTPLWILLKVVLLNLIYS